MKFGEPDGTSQYKLLLNNSWNYTFTSVGIGTVTLGLVYGEGFLKVEEKVFIVQGPAQNLQLQINKSAVDVFKLIEGTRHEFKLRNMIQPYQILRFVCYKA